MLLQGFVRVSSQIFMVSVGLQIKIWSLASVSRAITTPLQNLSCFIHCLHSVGCAITGKSLWSSQFHYHGFHSAHYHPLGH
jgi:hypothetical protein